jgi:hypothetical protein
MADVPQKAADPSRRPTQQPWADFVAKVGFDVALIDAAAF